jgi:hypothetical protein
MYRKVVYCRAKAGVEAELIEQLRAFEAAKVPATNQEWVTCGDCGGSGCPNCNCNGGFGIDKSIVPDATSTSLVWIECLQCNGNGCGTCNRKRGWYAQHKAF